MVVRFCVRGFAEIPVSIWKLVLGGLIVVGICSILCWGFGWCWWCPDCPDVDCCDDPAAQIILEDMHAGVWMPIENPAFHFDDPDDDDDDSDEDWMDVGFKLRYTQIPC